MTSGGDQSPLPKKTFKNRWDVDQRNQKKIGTFSACRDKKEQKWVEEELHHKAKMALEAVSTTRVRWTAHPKPWSRPTIKSGTRRRSGRKQHNPRGKNRSAPCDIKLCDQNLVAELNWDEMCRAQTSCSGRNVQREIAQQKEKDAAGRGRTKSQSGMDPPCAQVLSEIDTISSEVTLHRFRLFRLAISHWTLLLEQNVCAPQMVGVPLESDGLILTAALATHNTTIFYCRILPGQPFWIWNSENFHGNDNIRRVYT